MPTSGRSSGEVPQRKKPRHDVLSALDAVLSVMVIAPAVVSYWKSTWFLMDLYLFPNAPSYSGLASAVVGFSGQLFFALVQNCLRKSLLSVKSRMWFLFASRIYTAVFGLICINSWRGPWKLLDVYSGVAVLPVLACFVGGAVLLLISRTLRNVLATPYMIAVDEDQGYFDVPTMFNCDSSRSKTLYLLDCLFSVFIVGSLVVFVWRGAWTLLDLYVYPGDPSSSAWASLTIGYGIVFTTFALQNPLQVLCNGLKGITRVAVADIYIFFSFLGTVNVWRGVWNVLNIYFLPHSPYLSNWITHIACFLFLVLLNCSNSVLVRGVYIDGFEEGGKCIVFPVYYLRVYFPEKETDNYKLSANSDPQNEQLGPMLVEKEKFQLEAVDCNHSPVHQEKENSVEIVTTS